MQQIPVKIGVDGKKMPEVDGCGVVDNNPIEKDSIEIKIKFPEWELKKSIHVE